MDRCPECGCNRYHVDGRAAATWGDGEVESRRCDHCGECWEATIESDPPEREADDARFCVIFKRLRCPHCESPKHHVYRSIVDRGERYHRCARCGKTFKSIER